jgi:hypothetical protein
MKKDSMIPPGNGREKGRNSIGITAFFQLVEGTTTYRKTVSKPALLVTP